MGRMSNTIHCTRIAKRYKVHHKCLYISTSFVIIIIMTCIKPVRVELINNMVINKIISFLPKEGTYRAVIQSADIKKILKKGREGEALRLIFKLYLPHPVYEYRAGKTYFESQSTQLLEDLYEILGPEIQELFDDQNNLIPERLELLVGKSVTLEIAHVYADQEKPFCDVRNLKALRHPAGSSKNFVKN